MRRRSAAFGPSIRRLEIVRGDRASDRTKWPIELREDTSGPMSGRFSRRRVRFDRVGGSRWLGDAGVAKVGDDAIVPWDGDEYQERFDVLAGQGHDVHGEADFVMGLRPATLLDAGCGTGRVAIELARRGVEVVGVDADGSMITTARRRAPTLEWLESDLAELHLGRRFEVVVMAGNVPLFTPDGTQGALVAGAARHVAPGGALVAGFQIDRGYSLAEYDMAGGAAGLTLVERYATWDRQPISGGSSYAVSVHRRPPLGYERLRVPACGVPSSA